MRHLVIHKDCMTALPLLSDIDAVVTDPPYGLGFMGRHWDAPENIAFRPETWAAVMAAMKPGAHLAAFGGTRTFHRLMVAIEDAGFEMRDTLMWVYGSGFPKSLDVSKAIDKEAGAEREKITVPAAQIRNPKSVDGGHGISGGDRPWMQKAREQGFYEKDGNVPITDAARQWEGWGTAVKPAWEPIILARKPFDGTVARNVQKYGTGALNIEACRIPAEKATGWGGKAAGGDTWNETNCGLTKGGEARPVNGRWPANLIHDGSDEVVGAFPEAAGQLRAVGPEHASPSTVNAYGAYVDRASATPRGDSGSAARFFYAAKAPKSERAGSKHPTVKPLSLMRYLVRLITPPGGVVLDPFAGSGTTGVAALQEGFRTILIEREAEYVADIERRIKEQTSGY